MIMEIVINKEENFKIYEPTTDTLLVSDSLTSGLVNLEAFLKSIGKLDEESTLLDVKDVSFHMDSSTLVSMIMSNVELIKKLRARGSEFKASSNKFGLPATSSSIPVRKDRSLSDSGYHGYGKEYKKGGYNQKSGFSIGKKSSSFNRGSKNLSTSSFNNSKFNKK